MEHILVIIILAAMILWVVVEITTQLIARNKERKIKEEIREKVEENSKRRDLELSDHKAYLDKLSTTYGKPDCQLIIPLTREDPEDQSLYFYSFVDVFEKYRIIAFDDKTYSFQEILGYTIKDTSTESVITTTTGDSNSSTADVIGRSLVGGVIGGETGAIIGGLSSGRNMSTTSTSKTNKHENYIIFINLNSFSNPTIKIQTISIDALQELANILNIIISRNKK